MGGSDGSYSSITFNVGGEPDLGDFLALSSRVVDIDHSAVGRREISELLDLTEELQDPSRLGDDEVQSTRGPRPRGSSTEAARPR